MQITILGVQREYPENTSLEVISKEVQSEYAYPIILAKVNEKLRELQRCPEDGDVVEFITLASDIGHKTYRRGMILVFLKALYKVLDVTNSKAANILLTQPEVEEYVDIEEVKKLKEEVKQLKEDKKEEPKKKSKKSDK